MTEFFDSHIYDQVMAHWDSLAKPIDGLGDLERIVAQIGAVMGVDLPVIDRRTLLIFLSDNGIVANGVSQSQSEVTRSVACAISRNESTACVMAKKAGAIDHITLSGGCAKNEGLKKAIEKGLKIKVIELSVDPQLMGALGAAEFARRKGGAA